MLKLKLSKLKQICASVLLPRLLLKSLKYPNTELNYNRTIEQLSKARKSTNSGNKDEANDKQLKIIEKCFSENISETETKVYKKTNEIQNDNIITPEFYKVTKSDKCDTLISRLFNNKTDDVAKRDLMLDAKTQATTSKIEEEKLTQKVEIIDETPHVEAHAPKVEGFNATPKVLGHESCTFEMSKINNPAQDNGQQINLDELAKRCMGLSDEEIDKILIQELKNVSRNNSQPKSDSNYIENTYINNLPNFQSCYELNAHNECTFEKIQPTHLDSVPLLALDTSSMVTNDYKMCGLIKEYPTILSTADIDDPLLDVPALSPYEKQAIPFYEYINKENIAPEDDSKIETAAITETVEESEIIINDETLHRDAIDQGDPRDGQTLHPKPNINQFTEISEDQHIEISEEIDHLHKSRTQNKIFNVFNSQRLYTSNPDQPTDWHSHQDTPHHAQQKDEPSNSSISSAFLPGGNRRTLELPLNTAISANQNPEEYYTMSFPDEFVPENKPEPVQRIFADCPVAQNIIFSALPQVELEEVSKGTERIPNSSFNRKDLLSHVVLEPEVKEDVIISKPTEAKLEEFVDNKDRISCSESTIPLSVLLKKIREQNRLEYCRNIFAKADIKIEGTKKFACPPPLDKSKPKTSVKPCQPKPKPACEPCKPTPCPAKKDPCAKFLPLTFSSIFRYDIATDADSTSKEPSTTETMLHTSVTLITENIVKQIDEFAEKLKYISNDVKNLENATIYARDFEPWIPIPSWPISKKDKDRPFVCPKEGCKVPVVRTDKSSKEKQCEGVPKKSFALSQVFSF